MQMAKSWRSKGDIAPAVALALLLLFQTKRPVCVRVNVGALCWLRIGPENAMLLVWNRLSLQSGRKKTCLELPASIAEKFQWGVWVFQCQAILNWNQSCLISAHFRLSRFWWELFGGNRTLSSSPPAAQWFVSSRGHDVPGCGRLETEPCRSLDGLLGQLHHGNVSRDVGIFTIATDTSLILDGQLLVSHSVLVPKQSYRLTKVLIGGRRCARSISKVSLMGIKWTENHLQNF